MLRIGLTGGIGSGKSTVARLLAGHGAVVADADAIAREVVAPGTPGLAKVAGAFPGVVVDGALDRAALAEVVFSDPGRRRELEAITHPLIGARTAEIAASVPADGVLVHDVPLLVELGMAPAYHLVLVVEAPLDVRLARLTARGLPEQQARERIAHQATDARRREVADVVLDNAGTATDLERQVDALWTDRIVPYARNLAARTWAERGTPVLSDPNPDWPRQAARLAARITAATGRTVHHIGSTAVPGLAAKDVIDLMLDVADMADAEAIRDRLDDTGFPRRDGIDADEPKPPDLDPRLWTKRFHRNADPGRAVNVHVRAVGSPGHTAALAFRDWLREDAEVLADYLACKRSVADAPDIARYMAGKGPWFDAAWPRLLGRMAGTDRPAAAESVVPPA